MKNKVIIQHDGTDGPHPWELTINGNFVANFSTDAEALAEALIIDSQGFFRTCSGRLVVV